MIVAQGRLTPAQRSKRQQYYYEDQCEKLFKGKASKPAESFSPEKVANPNRIECPAGMFKEEIHVQKELPLEAPKVTGYKVFYSDQAAKYLGFATPHTWSAHLSYRRSKGLFVPPLYGNTHPKYYKQADLDYYKSTILKGTGPRVNARQSNAEGMHGRIKRILDVLPIHSHGTVVLEGEELPTQASSYAQWYARKLGYKIETSCRTGNLVIIRSA